MYFLMLDASKAFDRVRYCKLFTELLDSAISPLVLRILIYIYMYINQTLRVQLCQTLTSNLNYVMVSSKLGFCLPSYLPYMLTVCLVDWSKLVWVVT